jgi:F-type H+-transporting ATPase subunit gamma
MAQLSHIKQRINAVNKTQKITRAMRMIAMSLYSKLEHQKATLASYEKSIVEITTLLRHHRDTIPSMFVPEDLANPRPLIILCSSTKGLCGGMNSSILRYFEKTFMLEKQQRAHFATVGSRAYHFAKDRNPGELVYKAEESTIPTLSEIAHDIVSHICAQKDNPYTSVIVYYTHLKNFFLQVPMKASLLPLDLTGNGLMNAEELPNQAAYIWEQSPAQLGSVIARTYVQTRLVHMLFDNLISENAARFIAMDQSTNNADKYLEALNMAYNKSRQSLITREIAELSSNMV